MQARELLLPRQARRKAEREPQGDQRAQSLEVGVGPGGVEVERFFEPDELAATSLQMLTEGRVPRSHVDAYLADAVINGDALRRRSVSHVLNAVSINPEHVPGLAQVRRQLRIAQRRHKSRIRSMPR
jgi:hypothetical protein